MRFTPDNFLQLIKNIVMGANATIGGIGLGTAKASDGGIKVDNAIPLNYVGSGAASQITDLTGGTASTSVAAIAAGATYAQADIVAIKNGLSSIIKQLNLLTFTASETTALVLSIPAGTNASIGNFIFPIPRDYDENTDTYIVRVIIAINAADVAAGIKLTGTPTVKHIGTAAVAGAAVTATLPFQTAAATLTATETAYEIVLSGNALKRDDIIYVALALTGTTTQPVLVYAVENTYDSSIVSFNDTDKSGVDVGLSEYGNPLR